MADWIIRSTDLWSLRCFNGMYAYITQRASGVTRTCSRGDLPMPSKLDGLSDYQFNRMCSEVFHGEV